jgi:hypothetical protein
LLVQALRTLVPIPISPAKESEKLKDLFYGEVLVQRLRDWRAVIPDHCLAGVLVLKSLNIFIPFSLPLLFTEYFI